MYIYVYTRSGPPWHILGLPTQTNSPAQPNCIQLQCMESDPWLFPVVSQCQNWGWFHGFPVMILVRDGRKAQNPTIAVRVVQQWRCASLRPVTLTVLDPNELKGKAAMVMKQFLTSEAGVSRFRQRLFLEDGSQIEDDEILEIAPAEVQLVVLAFCQPDAVQTRQMVQACRQ